MTDEAGSRQGSERARHTKNATTLANPAMAPSSRLAVRFAQLPHDALAELAAQLCADGGAAAAAQAEAVLAAHQPVPQWAVEGVLLSSDLVPRVLAPLEQLRTC